MKKYFKFLYLLALVFAIGCEEPVEKPEASFEWFVKGKEAVKNPSLVEINDVVIFRALSKADLYSVFPGTSGYNFEQLIEGKDTISKGVGIPLAKKGAFYQAEYTFGSGLGDRSVTFVATNVGEYGAATEVATSKAGFKVVDYRSELTSAKVQLPGGLILPFKIDSDRNAVVEVADLYFTENLFSLKGFQLQGLEKGSAEVSLDGAPMAGITTLTATSSILNQATGLKIKITAHDARPGESAPGSSEYTLKLLQMTKKDYNNAPKIKLGSLPKANKCAVEQSETSIYLKLTPEFKDAAVKEATAKKLPAPVFTIELVGQQSDMAKQSKIEILKADKTLLYGWSEVVDKRAAIKTKFYDLGTIRYQNMTLPLSSPIVVDKNTAAYYVRVTSETGIVAEYPIYFTE